MKKEGIKSLVAVWIIIIGMITINSFNVPHKVFAYDNFGFYMYLPNLLIYHEVASTDIGFIQKINEQYELTPTLYQLSKTNENVWVIRFFSGLSILILPFFLIAHLFALVSSFPADGYSMPYFWGFWMAGIVYAALGLILLRKVLRQYLSDISVAVTLLLLYLGTNFYFFSSLSNPSPHIFVFAEYSFLLWVTMKWHQNQKVVYARLIGLTIGLMTITRLSEIISLLIPLLWGVHDIESLKNKWALVMKNRLQLLQLVLFAFLGGFPQVLYWLMATKSVWFNAYNDESSQLVLSKPEFINVLFGYRKGWLIYSPLMIFSIIGFVALYFKRRDIFWPIFLVFLINLYLIASFTSLVSYGYRAFIQSYAYIIIPFGFLVQWFISKGKWVWVVSGVFVAGIIYVNIVQAKQIQINTIHGSRMTKEYYWAVFLKKYPSEEDKKQLLIERSETSEEKLSNEVDFKSKTEFLENFENRGKYKSTQFDSLNVHEGKYSYRIDETIEYGPTLELVYSQVTQDYFAWFRPSVYVYPEYDVTANDVIFVFSFEHNGKSYKYKGINLKDPKLSLKANQWNKIEMDYLSPELLSPDDKMKFYIWNKGKQRLLIDDMQIISFTRHGH